MSDQEITAPPKAKYDLMSPSFFANPYPVFHRMRAEDPVYWHPDMRIWVLTRYADIQMTARDPRFSAERIGQLATGISEAMKPKFEVVARFLSHWIVSMDPPRHTAIRALVAKAFSPQVIEGMRPVVQGLVDEMIDTVAPSGQMDIIRDLSFPMPANVIGRMLGVPSSDIDMFKQWTSDIFFLLGAGMGTDEAIEAGHRGVTHLNAYFKDRIAERRRSPTDDLLSRLVQAEEQGAFLTEEELVSTCALLLVGGHETTTHFIGNAVLALLQHPEEMQKLRERPELMEGAVEELLRHDGSAFMVGRRALEDVELGGMTIKANDFTIGFTQAGNRDPAVFEDPDRLDLTRKGVRSLTFGYGIHFCIGAALARLEASIALDAILRRLPGLRLATETLDWLPSIAVRGLTSLPVAFQVRGAARPSDPPPSWRGPGSLRAPLSLRAPVSVPIPRDSWRPPSM